jgi:hypothetical protein
VPDRWEGYEYRCDRGHWIAAEHPVEECLVYVHGRRCDGILLRVGRGSRKTTNKKGER